MSIEDRLARLEAQMQEVADRHAIFECVKRNARGNDRFDAELVTSSYHPDGVQEIAGKEIPAVNYGDHANDAHDSLFDANLHNVTMHSCEIDGDVAHAESYSLGVFLEKGGEKGRILAGRYIDRLEKRDGVWGIVLRRVTVEVGFEGKASLPFGKPLPDSNYLRGDRDRSDIAYQRPLTISGGSRW